MVCNIQRCGETSSENNGDSHCSEVHSSGNTTKTKTDIAGRTVSVSEAAGNTATAYNSYFDQPSVVANALNYD